MAALPACLAALNKLIVRMENPDNSPELVSDFVKHSSFVEDAKAALIAAGFTE